MPDKKNDKEPKEPIDFSHPSIGGKKVGHPIPVQTEKELSFENLGGKCVRKASEHPMAEAKISPVA